MEGEDGTLPSQDIDFCTLGMFIIDEIHYLPPRPPVFDVLGGGGSFSALGARLFSPPPLSRSISWVVDQGADFPAPVLSQILSWNTSCLLRSDSKRLTTRGWNGYDEKQNRGFRYTTPKLRIEASDLPPELMWAKAFHMVCNPHRCIKIVTDILRARKAIDPTAEKPMFIWEPVPDLCVPSELLNTTNALPYVDICSPNHNELASLLGDNDSFHDPTTGQLSSSKVETACEQLLSSMPLQSYALVIRCGAQGCYVAKNGGRSRRPSTAKKRRPKNYARGGLTLDMDMESLFSGLMNAEGQIERVEVAVDPGVERWLPAYYTSETQERVVDPTGGGNGFLGGMAVALARGQSLVEAAAWGSVAASFMIEQVGTPVLTPGLEGASGTGIGMHTERWNGDYVEARLEGYLGRCGLTSAFQ